ncbi:MAG: NAD-dependent epimerase/dehydratase family protein, partial [Fidelibacterota bacterium]
PRLVTLGYDVTGLDTGYYRDGNLCHHHGEFFPQIINKDLRLITAKDLEGFDAVIHLAELSNDPLGEYIQDVTYDINHAGSVKLAENSKKAGVKKFIYTSSCSVYGVGNEAIRTEKSGVNPQTAYARCKVMVEHDVAELADKNFSPTFLRNATAYGISPRMRFDIVLNNLAGLAWTTGVIKLLSDGTPWRPIVHIRDISKAIECVLQAPPEITHNQIFNVGDTGENFQIKEIAEAVAEEFPNCALTIGKSEGDNRSYRVSFDKINAQLPGFQCQMNLKTGAKELKDLFKRIELDKSIFNFRAFTRLKQIKYLMDSNQVDENLFWEKTNTKS